jgi:glycosyltransferase involved in cell wall biosynthesis
VFAPAVRAAGLPLIFWQHGAHHGRHWLERWARRTPPDFAISTSRFAAGTLATVFPDVPSAVVYPPVPAAPPPDAAARTRLRHSLNVPDDAVLVVQVGRLDTGKGHPTLLDALTRLAANPSWRCWIVGGQQRPDEQRYLDSLKAAAHVLGDRVAFLGERRDVPALLQAADLFCHPNAAPEAFGIVFVEALQAGLPVVTSEIGGAAEIVDPTCGILLPALDPAALAAVLARLINDPALRHRLGAAGPARAAELCDPRRQLGRVADIAHALAHRGGF